jgi:lysozyme family protein
MHARALLALPLVLVVAVLSPCASAADRAGVAALQVGLRSHGLYRGPIDGLDGPGTAKAIRKLQKRAHITVDGVVGPQTRRSAASPGIASAAAR